MGAGLAVGEGAVLVLLGAQGGEAGFAPERRGGQWRREKSGRGKGKAERQWEARTGEKGQRHVKRGSDIVRL